MLVFRISSLTAESVFVAHCSIEVVRFSSVIRTICLSYPAVDIFVIYVGSRALGTLDVRVSGLSSHLESGPLLGDLRVWRVAIVL